METRTIECDILVLGGGLGGVAAAVRAARLGYRVCLTEENPWIGGQATSQGVSALDEHPHIEHFGGTELCTVNSALASARSIAANTN